MAMVESTTLPKIHEKLLDFTFEIKDAQFNHEGMYQIVCTLMNSQSKDFSQVRLRKNDGEFVTARKTQTDFTKQEQNAPLTFFKDKKFTFRLPKGRFIIFTPKRQAKANTIDTDQITVNSHYLKPLWTSRCFGCEITLYVV